MNREDFPMCGKNIVYFDNGATTLKPSVLVDALEEYYKEYTANAHRGDYDTSLIVDTKYEKTRELVKEFIHAKSAREIIFTSGTTDSLNKIIFGYFRYMLKEDDEVLLTKSEHASNVLPWFELKDEKKLNIRYIPLNKEYKLTLENVKKTITEKTKVISIAHVTNVVGDIRPLKEIIKYAHEKNILVLVDGAQSVPHMPYDVEDMDIDFLAFSAHKMCGPTGVGVLYGKESLLNNMRPIIYGGGMNANFTSDGIRIYDDIPRLFEAGTPNIAGVIAFGSVLAYLKNIGMDTIQKKELELRNYAIKKLKEMKEIILYNETSESGIITFNYENVFAQDLAIYLNKYHICVRAGNHCAKILKDELGIKNTCRMAFYFYNTFEEIDYFISVLKNPHLKEEII